MRSIGLGPMNSPTFKSLRSVLSARREGIATAPAWVLIVLCLGMSLPSRAALAEGPPAAGPSPGGTSLAAAERLLDVARVEVARGCAHPSDVLVSVLCEGHLRVGLRGYYPGFSVRDEAGAFTGFEPDIARRI